MAGKRKGAVDAEEYGPEPKRPRSEPEAGPSSAGTGPSSGPAVRVNLRGITNIATRLQEIRNELRTSNGLVDEQGVTLQRLVEV